MKDYTSYIEQIIKQYNFYFQMKLRSVPKIWKTSNKDHHCFVPSIHIIDIIDILYKLHEQLHKGSPLKFLDCGCGIGNVMMIAEVLGYDVYGIEYEEETCEIARNLVDDGSIIHGDIATFGGYADYDVIYYFAPIKGGEKRKKFLNRLAKDTKVGSVVISYGGSSFLPKDKRFKPLSLSETCWAYEKVNKARSDTNF